MYVDQLTAPAFRMAFSARRRRIEPRHAGIPVEEVTIRSATGVDVEAWFAAGAPGRGAVLLLHGITDNRLRMVPRMQFLNRAGFAVLAIDFQAHGMSGGERITIGALESYDVRAAVEWLRSRLPSEKVGAIAVSLGGAAALVGEFPLQVEALALESVYPDIERATSNRFRMYLGPLGAPASRFALSAGGRALGVDPDFLRPVDAIRDFRGAVFVLSGDRDRPTPIAEAIELFDSANEPKQFWAVGGARHEDLHAFAGAEYERRMLEFLSPTLAKGPT